MQVQIAETEAKIKHDKRGSDQAQALFKKFQTDEARFVEADAFRKLKPMVSDIFVRLAETLPANIAVDNLDVREKGLAMRLTVRGAPDAATGYATTYLEQLRADPKFALFDQAASNGFAITNVQRNTATGRLNVEFFLSLKPPASAIKKP